VATRFFRPEYKSIQPGYVRVRVQGGES